MAFPRCSADAAELALAIFGFVLTLASAGTWLVANAILDACGLLGELANPLAEALGPVVEAAGPAVGLVAGVGIGCLAAADWHARRGRGGRHGAGRGRGSKKRAGLGR